MKLYETSIYFVKIKYVFMQSLSRCTHSEIDPTHCCLLGNCSIIQPVSNPERRIQAHDLLYPSDRCAEGLWQHKVTVYLHVLSIWLLIVGIKTLGDKKKQANIKINIQVPSTRTSKKINKHHHILIMNQFLKRSHLHHLISNYYLPRMNHHHSLLNI